MEEPRIVGRYAVHGAIATGGMATVHLGRLLGPVGFSRTVALKRLHPQFASDPEFVAMFLDEARIAARIRHPNVAATLDVIAETGEVLLVMEYVEGETLARLIRASRQQRLDIPLAIVSAIGVGLLHGLHAAHEAVNERGEPLSIVHRDVSPQNVLVGVDGVPRVVDFGIAKAIGRSQVTREGELKGKLPYMAPEQLRRNGVPTRATDLYATAVVLWEALTAHRLFSGDDGHVIASVLANDVPSPRRHRPDMPDALEAVVMRGLSANPAERFLNAEAMAHALEEAVAPATASEIAAWVRSLAGEALITRARIAAAVESAIVKAPESKQRAGVRRVGLAVLLVLTGSLITWGVLRLVSEPEVTAKPVLADLPSVAVDASPSLAPSVIELEPVPIPPVASATGKPTIKPKTTTKTVKQGDCDPPYRFENGIKKFKPECL